MAGDVGHARHMRNAISSLVVVATMLTGGDASAVTPEEEAEFAALVRDAEIAKREAEITKSLRGSWTSPATDNAEWVLSFDTDAPGQYVRQFWVFTSRRSAEMVIESGVYAVAGDNIHFNPVESSCAKLTPVMPKRMSGVHVEGDRLTLLGDGGAVLFRRGFSESAKASTNVTYGCYHPSRKGFVRARLGRVKNTRSVAKTSTQEPPC